MELGWLWDGSGTDLGSDYHPTKLGPSEIDSRLIRGRPGVGLGPIRYSPGVDLGGSDCPQGGFRTCLENAGGDPSLVLAELSETNRRRIHFRRAASAGTRPARRSGGTGAATSPAARPHFAIAAVHASAACAMVGSPPPP